MIGKLSTKKTEKKREQGGQLQMVGYVGVVSKNEKRGGASGARFYPDQERWLAWCRDRIFVPKSAALRAAVRLLQLYVPEGSDERRASSIIRALASDECDDAELVVWAAGLAKTLHEVSAEKDRRPPRPGGGKTDGSVGD